MSFALGVALLPRARIVLLGYRDLSEQTPPGQARLQFEDRTQNRLDELVEAFDAIVTGESDPGVVTFVFGQTAAEVAARFRGPVLVVRRRGNEDGARRRTDRPRPPVG